MSAPAPTNGRPPSWELWDSDAPPAPRRLEAGACRPQAGGAGTIALTTALTETALRHLRHVAPAAGTELRGWQNRALAIPDPSLRGVAIGSLHKRGNVEGAALFATLAPPVARAPAVRALVAFQAAYNYLDALSEQVSHGGANAEQLHRALVVALDPEDVGHEDYYAFCLSREDGGLLVALVEACQEAFRALPSQRVVAALARGAAARIVDFQTLDCRGEDGAHGALERWPRDPSRAAERGLASWELASAAGSSLAVHALIAAAGEPDLHGHEAVAIDAVYGGPVGALHSLLDALADREEDRVSGHPSLLEGYASPHGVVIGLSDLIVAADAACGRLRDARLHRAILRAMCSYYLSAPGCADGLGRAVRASAGVLLGPSFALAMRTFALKRGLHRLGGTRYV